MSQNAPATPPIPALSLLLGYGAMLPLVGCAVVVWFVPAVWGVWLTRAGFAWAGAVLAFLGGVRRGVSFHTPGGPRIAQLATMLWLFGLAFLALLSPWRVVSLALLAIGYASLALLDPRAAARGEVPVHFARLRPAQMLVPIASLIVLTAFSLWRPGIS